MPISEKYDSHGDYELTAAKALTGTDKRDGGPSSSLSSRSPASPSGRKVGVLRDSSSSTSLCLRLLSLFDMVRFADKYYPVYVE